MSSTAETTPWKPSANPWLIAAAVMLATILEVLDTSVANVAVPHIAGNLSASTDEATWVLTSYLVSNAIVLPMTGWLGSFFGRKRFLIACIGLFTLASAACGAATTLGMLIFARILQGAAGGALQPLSQSILMESFPPAKRGMAMATFGLGVVVAPIIGPVLGGWITDNYSWRWIFYINVPMGVLAVLMCQAFIEDPPYLSHAREKLGGKIDYVGFGLLAVWLGTLQIILDRGQEDDWFNANWICWASVVSAAALIALIAWELRVEHPLVDIRVFRNRNFAMGTLLITVVGVVLYSTTALLPLFLQDVDGLSGLQQRHGHQSPRHGRIHFAVGGGDLDHAGRFADPDRDGVPRPGLGHRRLCEHQPGYRRGEYQVAGLVFRRRHGSDLRALDDHHYGCAAERADGQCGGRFQSHAEHRRQYRHRLGDHLGGPRRPGPSGLSGRASYAVPSALPASLSGDGGDAWPV